MTRSVGKRTFVRLAMMVFALWLVGEATAVACPNCRDALASDPDQAGMVQGLFWSIMFLLSMPFLIFTAMSTYFYWLVRSARRSAPLAAISGSSASFAVDDDTVGVEQPGSPFAESESEALEPAGV